jgi:hypothetical protein
MGITERQRQLGKTEEDERKLSRLLSRRLDRGTGQLLKDDLTSNTSERQARAAQVIGGLGSTALHLLIDVIKEEQDFRTRRLAAELLTELGPSAGEQLKRSLITEVPVEQRFRILEVIDTVTRDLRTELAYAFGDRAMKTLPLPKARSAAWPISTHLRPRWL